MGISPLGAHTRPLRVELVGGCVPQPLLSPTSLTDPTSKIVPSPPLVSSSWSVAPDVIVIEVPLLPPFVSPPPIDALDSAP